MISHVHRLIVVHIPRCGGTSLQQALGDATGRHQPASWYRQAYPEAWADYTRLVLTRPWAERRRSLHRYWTNLRAQTWHHFDRPDDRHRCYWAYRARAGETLAGLEAALPVLQAEPWTDHHFHPEDFFADCEGLQLCTLAEIQEAYPQLTIPHLNRSVDA